jgi:hypothetical protein
MQKTPPNKPSTLTSKQWWEGLADWLALSEARRAKLGKRDYVDQAVINWSADRDHLHAALQMRPARSRRARLVKERALACLGSQIGPGDIPIAAQRAVAARLAWPVARDLLTTAERA